MVRTSVVRQNSVSPAGQWAIPSNGLARPHSCGCDSPGPWQKRVAGRADRRRGSTDSPREGWITSWVARARAAGRESTWISSCRAEQERGVTVCLHLDQTSGFVEYTNLLPVNPLASIELEPPALDCEPGDVVALGCVVAPDLVVVEADMQQVDVSSEAAKRGLCASELPQDHSHRTRFFRLVQHDFIGHGR